MLRGIHQHSRITLPVLYMCTSVPYDTIVKICHHYVLLLTERALSRAYLVKMWSSKTLDLTPSRVEGHYSGLMHGLE